MVINALKWLVNFLETRFPEKVQPVSVETFRLAIEELRKVDERRDAQLETQAAELKKAHEQIEILNLRVGLTRPTQSAFGRKLNG